MVRANSVACLNELGYRTLEADDGRSALDVLARHPEVVLLFTDVGLPGGVNGRLLAEEACRRQPGLRVLFTTGYARNAIVHDGRLDRGVELVTKPFNKAVLAAAVTALLKDLPERPRILLVEDEFLIRSYAVELLRDMGIAVVDVGTADAAIEDLRRAEGGFEAALIDIGLPGRRGDSLMAEVRERYPNLPVLVVTGDPNHAVAGPLAADPKIRVPGKPYPAEKLAGLLRELGVGVS
ncbi:MAG: response regulator [Proteobacteria bacterium]|nr:response regulator [Pseudomonadota bacterium]